MIVKICGITRLEDAEAAVALGADVLGFVFWPKSPRFVDPYRARAIAAALPPLVRTVGVFVNQPAEYVNGVASLVRLSAVQLHGDEAVEDFAGVDARILRGMSVEDDDALDLAVRLPAAVMPLVDAADRSRRGGTGQLADWDRAYALAGQRP